MIENKRYGTVLKSNKSDYINLLIGYACYFGISIKFYGKDSHIWIELEGAAEKVNEFLEHVEV